jgi:hypothetical protein
METCNTTTTDGVRERAAVPNPYGWWFADCPRHGRTPHLSVLGGLCERCAAERQAKFNKRTRQ